MVSIDEGIFHRPYGDEHPYQQAADERFPRHPQAGEAVYLGARTLPAGSAQKVWATWSVNDTGMSQHTEAVLINSQLEGSFWSVALPAFQADDQVTYQLHALQGDKQISTSVFAFDVLHWVECPAKVNYQLTPQGLEVIYPAGPDLAETRLKVAWVRHDQLHFHLVYAGNGNNEPQLDVSKPYSIEKETANEVVLSSAELRLVLQLEPYRLTVQRSDRTIVLDQVVPPGWQLQGETVKQVSVSYVSPAGEGFYGFGERFNGLNQRGHSLDVRVYEEYKNQGLRTYIPMPFFVSSQGYGFYFHTSFRVRYDLAASQSNCWTSQVELGCDASLEWEVFAAKNPLENVRAFSNLLGKPVLPPNWVFGPWMSSNEWNSQAEVLKQVALTQKHGIPASVLVIEAWSDEATFYIWNDARYQAKPGAEAFRYQDFEFPADGLWPDPKGMVDYLHSQGIKLVLWQIPVLKKLDEPHAQQDADREYMVSQKYCVCHADGSPYLVRSPWFKHGHLLDPTSPEAMEWWMNKRAYLLEDLGVDGFKTDGGEHLWADDVIFANGKTGAEITNQYPNLYVGGYYRYANQKRDGQAVTFSRAGFTGTQAFPCHWAGDENSTWPAFRASLMAGLNIGLSGVPFWAWDIAGFSGVIPSAELYLRATAMAAFCPIMQYHSEFNQHRTPNVDRTPWNIAERTGRPEVIDIYRKFAVLRQELLPYIYEEARFSAENGLPMMRPLFLDWPEDRQAWAIEDQYCFGRSLLVAPVLQEGAVERKVYLPAGEWEDFWSKQKVSGGQWLTCQAGWDTIPVFRRLA